MYSIIFKDNTIFKGNNPENSNWNSMPNKLIKSITYKYKNRTVILENYCEYNHIVKRGNIIVGGGFSGILKVIVMGRTKKESNLFIWDLKRGEFYSATAEINKEYEGKKVTGWKEGVIDGKSTYKII